MKKKPKTDARRRRAALRRRRAASLPLPEVPKLQKLSWLATGIERNPDGLPPGLTPHAGCPICGSVWVEVRDVGFEVEPRRMGGNFHPGGITWYVEAVSFVPVSAVRLVCASEHRLDYDGRDFVPAPDGARGLSTASVILSTAALVAGWSLLLGYVGHKHKK